MMSRLVLTVALSGALLASGQDLKSAQDLYHHTDYAGSLKILRAIKSPDARVYFLMGQSLFMTGDYKPATEYFQRALDLDQKNSIFANWLGRAWGRRAETSNPFTAPSAASHARQYFELAVSLDPSNKEATGDLLDYYLDAPGFLGGGLDKASALAQQIGKSDPAEGHWAEAQVAERRKQFDTVEDQLRRAVAVAPHQVGHVLALARCLAKQGRVQESEAQFAQAEMLAPNDPFVIYARAKTYVETKRNLAQARDLLKKYLQSNLTPDNPTREEAQKLLLRASGG